MITGRSRSRGQSLVEFALVAPIVIAVIAAIIQFGVVFWAQNTLTQVVRDTGRWAATQPAAVTTDCKDATAVIAQANNIASNSSLIGYSTAKFTATANWTTSTWTTPTDPPTSSTTTTCPTKNTTVTYVHITATQQVPTFFPGMEYLPLLGTCDNTGCHITLSSTAQFRMEPNP
jgi:Flp pilus assembly protein TadG